MSTHEWQYDHARHEYYVWDAARSAYIYQSGRIIRVGAQASTSESTNETIPRSLVNASNSGTDDQTAQLEQFSSLSISPQDADATNAYGVGYSATGTPYQYPNSHAATSALGYNRYEINTTNSTGLNGSILQRGPAPDITEPSLYNAGIQAHGKIPSSGTNDVLHSSFKIRNSPKKFFKVGKVFKIMWPELAGRPNDNITIITADTKFAGEQIAYKIRWFVVVKEGTDCCSCLPIMTYGGRGCEKPGVIKFQHAIVYSGKKAPSPKKGEIAGVGERGMLKPIRVDAKSRQDKLDELSRINFAKIYTVEHNVKVYDFGSVPEKSVHLLTSQWVYVLQRDESGNVVLGFGNDRGSEAAQHQTSASTMMPQSILRRREEDDEDEDEDEDDDDEEDEED